MHCISKGVIKEFLYCMLNLEVEINYSNYIYSCTVEVHEVLFHAHYSVYTLSDKCIYKTYHKYLVSFSHSFLFLLFPFWPSLFSFSIAFLCSSLISFIIS